MTLEQDTKSAVEALAQATRSRHGLPGLVLGIVGEEGLLWSGGFGVVCLDGTDCPDENTVVRIASVTKTFTTTAILQLRDEGLLGLDDPLHQHIPEFGQAVERGGTVEEVTLRRLLTHRAGLVTESPVRGWGSLDFPSREEVLEALPRTEVVIPSDSAWKYSNLGFGLLGEVVSRLGRCSYDDYIRANILEPLDLESTSLDLTESMQQRAFCGYNLPAFQDRPETAPYAHLNGIAAAGQLHSTVADLARWVAFQFRGDGGARQGSQVLNGRTLNEMHRPQYVEPDWSAGQCLGWRATRVGNRVYHNHGGGIHGFSTQVWFDLASRAGAIVLMNMWPPPGGQNLAQDVLELLLGEAAPELPEPPGFEAAPEELERFLGHYCAAPGIHVHIEFRDGQLCLTGPTGRPYSLHAPAQLEPTADADKWLVRGGRGAGELATFEFDQNGEVAGYALGGFLFRRTRERASE
ncbi:MAG: serine hydrolase domain-containing protein [Candidatus Latescibacterota bacterium]|nr:serine hydrolase domain-containing protein [Candidatus Latescibacterota bacterium]